jgi:hypothetical protein
MRNLLCLVLLAGFGIPPNTAAQSFLDTLVRLEAPETMAEAITAASKPGNGSRQEFWLGLQFDLRDDIKFRLIHITENGGVNIETGENRLNYNSGWTKEPWFNMAYLRTMGIRAQPPNWGLFIRYSTPSGRFKPDKIILATFDSVDRSDFDADVFWAAGVPRTASFDYLRAAVEEGRHPDSIRRAGAFALSLYDHPDLIKTLAKTLSKSTTDKIFKDVALWLALIPRPESLDVLTAEYGRTTGTERKKHLIFAISQHGSDASAKALIEIADSEKSHESRKDAIFWLGQLAGRKTLQVLSDIAMSDPELEIKKHAVFVLSQHGEKDEAAELLIGIAETHPEPEVRKAAMFWLGQTDSDKALVFFRKVLSD